VEKLFGETALRRRRFEVVFVFGEIFGHCDELSSHVVPGIKYDLRWAVGGFNGGVFLHSVLSARGQNEGCGDQDGYG
jgi:hypothetical protein